MKKRLKIILAVITNYSKMRYDKQQKKDLSLQTAII